MTTPTLARRLGRLVPVFAVGAIVGLLAGVGGTLLILQLTSTL